MHNICYLITLCALNVHFERLKKYKHSIGVEWELPVGAASKNVIPFEGDIFKYWLVPVGYYFSM